MTKPIEFDVETTGLQPWSGTQHAFMYCFYDGQEAVSLRYSPDDKSNHEEIQRWFNKANDTGIRAWNSKFDRASEKPQASSCPATASGTTAWSSRTPWTSAAAWRSRRSPRTVRRGGRRPQKKVKGWLAEERRRRKKAAEEAGTELTEPNYSDVPLDIMEPYALEDVILTRRVSDHYDVLLKNDPDLKRPDRVRARGHGRAVRRGEARPPGAAGLLPEA